MLLLIGGCRRYRTWLQCVAEGRRNGFTIIAPEAFVRIGPDDLVQISVSILMASQGVEVRAKGIRRDARPRVIQVIRRDDGYHIGEWRARRHGI